MQIHKSLRSCGVKCKVTAVNRSTKKVPLGRSSISGVWGYRFGLVVSPKQTLPHRTPMMIVACPTLDAKFCHDTFPLCRLIGQGPTVGKIDSGYCSSGAVGRIKKKLDPVLPSLMVSTPIRNQTKKINSGRQDPYYRIPGVRIQNTRKSAYDLPDYTPVICEALGVHSRNHKNYTVLI